MICDDIIWLSMKCSHRNLANANPDTFSKLRRWRPYLMAHCQVKVVLKPPRRYLFQSLGTKWLRVQILRSLCFRWKWSLKGLKSKVVLMWGLNLKSIPIIRVQCFPIRWQLADSEFVLRRAEWAKLSQLLTLKDIPTTERSQMLSGFGCLNNPLAFIQRALPWSRNLGGQTHGRENCLSHVVYSACTKYILYNIYKSSNSICYITYSHIHICIIICKKMVTGQGHINSIHL